ncbi:MAG: excinuclease ABC subunit UvrA [Candidatus Kapabacteria bacterium]|nr:excinuclease ABC subunit UvrA [Ignavibacteriota bacterium]MCW5884400.1 excinuclease ABC subunit UvrA [Candidatus Kapabacteria bacterium]
MKNSNLKDSKKYISIRGAKLHNLKNIDVDIPRNKLTVVSGVSGSGKSTLAFDTIYAEGQRRFVESLSSYARQFLERMHKPDAESISGIPPAIAIQQNVQTRNPRSTVGTTTEIYDYLRLLFGRIGRTVCYNCGAEVRRDTPQFVVEQIMKNEENDRIYLAFPFPENARDLKSYIELYKEAGYFRYINLKSKIVFSYEEVELLKEIDASSGAVVVDRLVLKTDDEILTRLTDSVESAFKMSSGKCIVINLTSNKQRLFSTAYECTDCGIVYEEPDPKLFSFNNPHGACPKCQGFGRTVGIDESLVIPDMGKSLSQAAIHPFKGEAMSKFMRDLLRTAIKCNIDINKPVYNFTDDELNFIWNGHGDYIGLHEFFKMLEENSHKMQYRILMSRYRGYTKCKACNGSRIRTSARQVFVGNQNIPQLINLPFEKLLEYFEKLELNEYETTVAGQVLNELKWRCKLLVEIGLDYINLARLSHTLSGGESQRISLSTALGSSLVGTLYVLDEPSIGMHPRDTGRLLNILFKIRNLGNTVLVVEHDPDIIRFADYLIDMGPDAGSDGGEIVFEGVFKDVLKSERSLTGQYLSNRKKVPLPEKRRKLTDKKLVIPKARDNNLKIEDLEIPLECIVCVTGVSGSGKSTLVHDVIYNNIKRNIGSYNLKNAKFEGILGYEQIENIEIVDQSSIGKSSRSTPATYSKSFDFIRELFSSTQASKQLGWRPGHFSFNVAGGRCEACEGEGIVTVEMQFLPDVALECESCRGTRYKKEVQNILYNGKSIVDVLDMTVDEAIKFFEDKPKIARKLLTLQDVGLGYLKLGQPSTMLSGGESQRIKLAGSLDSSYEGHTLFIFDEPTTGLHLDDISKLINCFDRLAAKGNSIIIIEHNLSIVASADYIIDLGPEAGENGGTVVATGTPEQICKVKNSYTGIALADYFKMIKHKY